MKSKALRPVVDPNSARNERLRSANFGLRRKQGRNRIENLSWVIFARAGGGAVSPSTPEMAPRPANCAERQNQPAAPECAISALVMHGDEKTRRSAWKQLALVGRDIASDAPLDQIPLMKQVAETSVRAFERRL
jgi:hypothetical protein